MQKHVPHFEVLRGFAAIWVLLSHVFLITGIHIKFLSSGAQAVEVFVMLSGFVIALLINIEREAYGKYIFRRLARIYPLFLVALVYGMATDHLYASVFGGSPWVDEYVEAFQTREVNSDMYLWQHIALHLTMLHGMVPDSILPQAALMFSGPLWSISLEWQFYLIAPVLVWAISFGSPRRIATSVAVFVASLLLWRLTRDPWIGSVPAFLPLRLPLFIAGIASAALWHRARVTPPIPLAIWVLAASVVVAVTAPSQFPIAIWAAVYYLAATHGRLAILSKIDAIFTWSVFRYLGRISFGVYVLHVPTMMLICYYIVFPLFGHLHSVIGALTISLLTMPTVIALASLTYRVVELPFIKLGRTAFQRAPAVGERVPSIK